MNCNTMMESLEALLQEHNILFHRYGNCIQLVCLQYISIYSDFTFYSCFPYIINIAVQSVLKDLKENLRQPVLDSSSDPLFKLQLQKYADALATYPVGGARSLVGVYQKSSQHWSDLQTTIKEGNIKGEFYNDDRTLVPVMPPLQLLRDCETHWSSTFNMTGHVITLYLVTFIYSCLVTEMLYRPSCHLSEYLNMQNLGTTFCRPQVECPQGHTSDSGSASCSTAAPFVKSDSKPIGCTTCF